ncbi:hypothetical protein PFICI_05369 [Pestalotiopsis fici W106-1]|uniref:Fascin domain-containing protein n=1 Tax=Pestalotiopsis fici (strain W106-1 / CGMCC3.15140) TaxID=1229662 RepID=W3XBN2_PESFW|nr:uncharacterized protein PFICI_05369 [Pestalotiopsis fici W106-1]ETS83493.1 hypothetical protein PFICI_05369 [Pestalotiopsis fici W106-1]
MAAIDAANDDASDTSIGSPNLDTVASCSTVDDDPNDGFCGLLPGNTYMILERESLRAMTLTNEGLRLKHIEEGQSLNNRWLCVEKNGWLGLQEPKSGKYIGHDGKSGVRAAANGFHAWEYITTRDRPGGVYQLLVPHWWEALRVIVVAEDGESLITRQHGETLWRFLRTSGTGSN